MNIGYKGRNKYEYDGSADDMNISMLSNEILAIIFEFVGPGLDRLNMLSVCHAWNQMGYALFFTVAFCRSILPWVIISDKKQMALQIVKYHPTSGLFNTRTLGLAVIHNRIEMIMELPWFPISKEDLPNYFRIILDYANPIVIEFFFRHINDSDLSEFRTNLYKKQVMYTAKPMDLVNILFDIACEKGFIRLLHSIDMLYLRLPNLTINIDRGKQRVIYCAANRYNDFVKHLFDVHFFKQNFHSMDILRIVCEYDNLELLNYVLETRPEFIFREESLNYLRIAMCQWNTKCLQRLLKENWIIEKFPMPLLEPFMQHTHPWVIHDPKVYSVLLSSQCVLTNSDQLDILTYSISKNVCANVRVILQNKKLIIPQNIPFLSISAHCNYGEMMEMLMEDGRIDPNSDSRVLTYALNNWMDAEDDISLMLLLKDGRINVFDGVIDNAIIAGKVTNFSWRVYLLLVNYKGYDAERWPIYCGDMKL